MTQAVPAPDHPGVKAGQPAGSATNPEAHTSRADPSAAADPGLPAAQPAGNRVRWALGVAAFLIPYLFGFWFTIYTSIHLLGGGNGDLGMSRWGAVALVSTCTAIGIAIALVLTRWRLKLSWSALGLVRPRGLRITHGLVLFCTAYFLMWVAQSAFGIVPRIGEPTLPADGSSPSGLYQLISALLAGVGEEILIVAIPVAVMTALRWRWSIQIIVLIILRTPFHLYYGYTAIILAVVWSILYWLLYRRYRWVWPLVAAHALYNCVVNRAAFGATGSVVVLLAGIVALLVGGGTVVRQIRIDRRTTHDATAAGIGH